MADDDDDATESADESADETVSGDCPNGGNHEWENDGAHRMRCAKCSAEHMI